MIATEMATLVRFVRALCPAQKIDEYTPDAWMLVIGDLEFADAEAAVKTLGRSQPFIAAADIATEVHRMRAKRLGGWAETEPDVEDPDDWRAYIAALRDQRFKAASSTAELRSRPMRAITAKAFQHVPSVWDRSAQIVHRRFQALPAKPMRELPAVDPEHAAAEQLLSQLPNRQVWITKARAELEVEGVRLTRAAEAIRAADLATRTDHTDQGA
jgi:hypothetical protein